MGVGREQPRPRLVAGVAVAVDIPSPSPVAVAVAVATAVGLVAAAVRRERSSDVAHHHAHCLHSVSGFQAGVAEGVELAHHLWVRGEWW